MPFFLGISGSPDASIASLHLVTVEGSRPNQSNSVDCLIVLARFFAVVELLRGHGGGVASVRLTSKRGAASLRGGI